MIFNSFKDRICRSKTIPLRTKNNNWYFLQI